MEESKPLYEGGMRPSESAAVLYELPVIVAALVLALALAVLVRYLVMHFELYEERWRVFVMLGGLDAIGLLAVFWAASYYPRRVTVFPDRIRFKMMFGAREKKAGELASVEELSLEQARSTFFSVACRNLSPSVGGSVMLKWKQGRAWVLSPEDPAAFAAAVKKIMEAESGRE